MGAFKRALAALFVLALVAAVARSETAQDTGNEGNNVTGAVPDADFRLSGIVAVNGEPRLAVIELAGRGGRMVRIGDAVHGGARVEAIGPDWVRLDRDGEQRILRLISLPAGRVPEATPPPAMPTSGGPAAADKPPVPGVLAAEGELQEIIAGVAADETNTVDVLAAALGAYLGLPADTEIAVTDMSFGAFDSAAAAKRALDEKGMIRVRLGASGGERMLYLQAPPPEKAQGAVDEP